ncbi:hypothetical protein FQN54_004011 [Arachnomyces sp. PD_36]|nr:hypothetical protein FQN54_004011 [Arachnomyces sp. PD_36]
MSWTTAQRASAVIGIATSTIGIIAASISVKDAAFGVTVNTKDIPMLNLYLGLGFRRHRHHWRRN